MISVARFLPAASRYLRQIVPPVIATLVAAVLIQGYNRAFSGQLTQPRMAAMQAEASVPATPEPEANASAVGMTKPPAAPVTEYVTIYERAEPDRLTDKDDGREAGKEQAPIKAAVPPRTAAVTPAVSPAVKPAPAQRAATSAPVVAAPPVTTSIAVAPVPAEPPPVIVAVPQTYAMAPQGPQEPAVAVEAPPRRGALGAIANALNPAALFSRAREFGAKIEQTGNVRP